MSEKERRLRDSLSEMRDAIDRYKDIAESRSGSDQGRLARIGETLNDTLGPPSSF